MKVAFYRHSLLNRGGDKMVVIYANYLANKGHTVVIYTNILDTGFYISDKIYVKQIPWRTKLGTILWILTHKIKADIIVADIIIMAVALFFLNNRKVVYFAQDYDVYYYRDKIRRKLINIIYYIGLRALGIPCIAVSYALRRELTVYSEGIEVVPNGIDLGAFYPDPKSEIARLKEDKKAILVFGRKDPRKGFDLACRVIRELSGQVFNKVLEIWIVGDDAGYELPFETRYFGYVGENRLRKILSCADVFLYPSRHEGLPLFVLEALACHCPVVTTRATNFLAHLKEAWISDIEDTHSLVNGLKYVLFECSGELFIRKGKLLLERYNILDSCARFERFLVGRYENRY